ncbi:ATP-binding protein [Actinosynnema sp. NPDC023794]
MTDAHADPDHPRHRPFPDIDTTTGSREAKTVTQDERGADGHAEEGRVADQAEFEVSLPCDNLAAVRRRIGDALHPHDDDFVHDVQLVATELASNACDHADDPRYLLLRREIHPDRGPELVVEAHDATPDRTPVVGSSSISPHRGNGMKIVQTICNDWGVRHGDAGKVVWGRIPMP